MFIQHSAVGMVLVFGLSAVMSVVLCRDLTNLISVVLGTTASLGNQFMLLHALRSSYLPARWAGPQLFLVSSDRPALWATLVLLLSTGTFDRRSWHGARDSYASSNDHLAC